MNWLDVLIVFLVGGIALFEMARGFGRAAFDALAIYGALWGATTVAGMAAATVKFNLDPAANHSLLFGILFVVFGAIMLFVSKFVYGAMPMNAGMMDLFLGFVCGMAVGTMCAHGMVEAMAFRDPTGEGSAAVVFNGLLGKELLNFTSFHSIIDTITGATSYHRELPDLNH